MCRSCWMDVKFKKGLDFPNLPYLLDGEMKLTQTNAILRYLGRKYDLEGKTETDKGRVDMMLDNAMEFRNGFVGICYPHHSPNVKFEDKKEKYLQKLESKLEVFCKFLGNRPFFAADYVTVVDFHMYEMLYSHEKLAPELMKKFPTLLAFITRMEALPRISDFLKSDRSPKPMNNRMADFGAK